MIARSYHDEYHDEHHSSNPITRSNLSSNRRGTHDVTPDHPLSLFIPTPLPPPEPAPSPPPPSDPRLVYPPPTYDSIYHYEQNLPQHDLSLHYPEGQSGRYVKFANQIRGLGWNNCLNEVLLNAHLAYESKRAYVFQEYHWKPDYFPWQPVDPSVRPLPRTPLNALLSGPVAGSLWDPGDPAPRSVSEFWFDTVCPVEERRIIHTEDIKSAVAWSPGDVVFDHWRQVLLDAPERCIEILVSQPDIDAYGQTFDLWLWGTERILPMWDRFRDSPVSRLLEPSPLVTSAVARNEMLFRPRTPGVRDPYARLMAVHVRRGDYAHACLDLANWNATYYSWNLLHFLPDAFPPPPGGEPGHNTPENVAAYMAHCMPEMESILSTIANARDEYIRASSSDGTDTPPVDAIFILTNEQTEWLGLLKDELGRAGWATIVTSRDLQLDKEQYAVSMAVDMDIARRAAIFIGNGWSSFTSNIVHTRLRDGKIPMSIRFW